MTMPSPRRGEVGTSDSDGRLLIGLNNGCMEEWTRDEEEKAGWRRARAKECHAKGAGSWPTRYVQVVL